MSLKNPMGISGPAWAGNATQPDYRVPTVNANVASYAQGADILLAQPISAYVQPNYATHPTPAWPLGQASNAGSPFRLQ